MADKKRTHIVIVGAGFGGVKLARLLAREAVDITVVDRNQFHLFQPLLYQVATAELEENEIACPIRSLFRHQPNVDFLMAHAEGIFPEENKLRTDRGDVAYDYLVLAAGATTNYFGQEEVARHAFGLKTLQEASRIRDHVLRMVELASHEKDEGARRRLLTFVCVGGGPTGVECAGALSELLYDVLSHEVRGLDVAEVRILLVEAMGQVLAMVPEPLQQEALRVLREVRRVDVRLHTAVTSYDGAALTLQGGEVVPTATVIWAAGVKAVSLMKTLGTALDRSGRVVVQPTLQIKEYPNIFALGDCACFIEDGRPLPTVAPVATQQAEICASNLKKCMAGEKALDPFAYHDVGAMATICRGHAVLAMGKWQMKGFFAWAAWMAVHLLRLAGVHTNVMVLYKWVWNFFFGLRLGRIIRDTALRD
ncbi:MAG: NAD(P)/FAD-dependent oxidoreductase [Schwartzia sp. (in: firmicutes)]